MEFQLYIPPRMERKVKKMAENLEFNEIWEFMGRYGMTGWYYFLGNADFHKIEDQLKTIDLNVDYIVSLGTGGSYQGIEMLVEFSPFKDQFIFIGPSLDPEENIRIMKKLEGKKVGFNIISKSGGTLEILTFINLYKPFIESAQWISIITSNPSFVAFFKTHFQKVQNIQSFKISNDIGGRFSIASTMGFVVAYLARINFYDFLKGFINARNRMENGENLIPLERGIVRYSLFSGGKILENLATNSRKVYPTLRWSRQLWAESNGKEYKGMFVSSGFYPEDAHSVGQIWKEGPRAITETYYLLKKNHSLLPFEGKLTLNDMKIKANSMEEINTAFIEGIIEDRFESGIPVSVYRLDDFTLHTWGELCFSEMVGVVVEAYFLGVNPFNQPGVESYKEKVKSKLL